MAAGISMVILKSGYELSLDLHDKIVDGIHRAGGRNSTVCIAFRQICSNPYIQPKCSNGVLEKLAKCFLIEIISSSAEGEIQEFIIDSAVQAVALEVLHQ